jgi:hypothetical protein
MGSDPSFLDQLQKILDSGNAPVAVVILLGYGLITLTSVLGKLTSAVGKWLDRPRNSSGAVQVAASQFDLVIQELRHLSEKVSRIDDAVSRVERDRMDKLEMDGITLQRIERIEGAVEHIRMTRVCRWQEPEQRIA